MKTDAGARHAGAFFKASAPASQERRLRRLGVSGASALGAPSIWLFLGRLHACRAGLRFARRCQHRRWAAAKQGERRQATDALEVKPSFLSRRGLVRAIGTVPGAWQHHRVSEGSPATRLRLLASERIQFWVLSRPVPQARLTRIEGGSRAAKQSPRLPAKPPAGSATKQVSPKEAGLYQSMRDDQENQRRGLRSLCANWDFARKITAWA
jgi:hypothetical protein